VARMRQLDERVLMELRVAAELSGVRRAIKHIMISISECWEKYTCYTSATW